MKEPITLIDYREKVKYKGISAYLCQPQELCSSLPFGPSSPSPPSLPSGTSAVAPPPYDSFPACRFLLF